MLRPNGWRLIHTHHAVPLPCRVAKALDCVFPVWITQCVRVWFTHTMSSPAVLRPCCFASDFSRPRHSTAGARYSMCELAQLFCIIFWDPGLNFDPQCVYPNTFCAIPQCLQTNVGIVAQIRLQLSFHLTWLYVSENTSTFPVTGFSLSPTSQICIFFEVFVLVEYCVAFIGT
jgi:hypothetical protein